MSCWSVRLATVDTEERTIVRRVSMLRVYFLRLSLNARQNRVQASVLWTRRRVTAALCRVTLAVCCVTVTLS